MKLIVTFQTVSSALYLEKLLPASFFDYRVVPVPRSLSSSCGYAGRLETETPEILADIMDAADVEWEAIYQEQATEDGKNPYLLLRQYPE